MFWSWIKVFKKLLSSTENFMGIIKSGLHLQPLVHNFGIVLCLLPSYGTLNCCDTENMAPQALNEPLGVVIYVHRTGK